MARLTDSEWKVMEALWQGGPQTLGEVLARLAEDTGWSWRYDATYDPDKPDGCTLTAGHNSGSITCTNTLKNDRWLNGFSDVIANIFGIRH